MTTFLRHWAQAFVVWCAILGAILLGGKAIDWLFTAFGVKRGWALIGFVVALIYAAVVTALDRRRMIR